MNIIILNPRRGGSRTLHLPRWLGWAGALLLVVLPLSAGIGAYYISHYIDQPLFSDEVAQRWHDDVRGQQEQLAVLQRQADEEMRALTLRLADMQARLLRLDALGERLLDVAGIRADEFDFPLRRPWVARRRSVTTPIWPTHHRPLSMRLVIWLTRWSAARSN